MPLERSRNQGPWDETGMDQTNSRPETQKRSKRARYAARACLPCQTRKIRCEGGIPCRHCSGKGRECSFDDHQQTTSSRQDIGTTRYVGPDTSVTRRRSSLTSSARNTGKSRITTSEMYERLVNIERQLEVSKSRGGMYALSENEFEASTPISEQGSPMTLSNVDAGDRQTRSIGARSISGLEQAPMNGPSNNRRISETYNENFSKQDSKSWLRNLLSSFDVIPESLECRTFLRVFFDEVYILYPFLHPPAIWQTFNYIWENSLMASLEQLEKQGESKLTVALLFVCLALGRCTASPRNADADGNQSSGWSIYSAATELVRPFLDVTSDSSISLQSLQLLAMMVVYLVRLDAYERADRTLAHAISSAHILGIHRTEFYVGLSAFNEEMFNRLWWNIYMIDRRLSLDSSRPFLIQDVNIKIRLPWPLTDAWLEERRRASASLSDLEAEVEVEKNIAKATHVPYLEAFISQSRIAADVWKAVYNTKETNGNSSGMMYQYLDVALDNWWQVLPPSLKYREGIAYADQFSDMAWWQAKQSILLFMRYTLLKLLIRSTSSPSKDTAVSQERLATDAYCAQLAASVIQTYELVPRSFSRYSFPFISPMMSATMILHGLTFRRPALRNAYGRALLVASNALVSFCQNTWVSGKMIRTTSKLSAMIQSTLSQSGSEDGEGTASSNQQPEQGLWYEQTLPNIQSTVRSTNPVLRQQQQPTTTIPNDHDQSKVRVLPSGSLPSPVSTASVALQRALPGMEGPMLPDHLPWTLQQNPLNQMTTTLSEPANFASLDLPDWIATDFDFEQAGNMQGGEGRSGLIGTDLFSFDIGWTQSFGI